MDLGPERKEYAPHNTMRAGQHEQRAARQDIDLESLYSDMAKNVPMGRVGHAAEETNVIAFLASNAASYVTGSSINIDGGASAVF